MDTQNKNTCKQCGNCCREGGPALHVEDLEIIRSGQGPDLVHIVTLRRGEHAYDQVTNSFAPLKEELLKLKGSQGTWTCTFYSNEAAMCTIYEHRPSECRALNCRAPEELYEVYTHERISRRDLIPQGHPLLELIDEHERQCPAEEIARLATPATTGDAEAAERLAHMVRYDDEIRKLVPEKSGMDPEGMDFFFGRPVRTLLRQFATAVNIEKGGKMVFRKIPKGQ
ncbi:YkgJ family cysteine cluster protein [Salidesulfovibrio onnuriiensis]|uniref:YkgJ family cysteine cluster protein n=1 Tax=Salidesulfovibrio onnuriiensis TaxID=2583823 RepID=UPI0011C7E664|nr:YkgJ family cysteine cluster protein [Salidesulfovibrio onnuriiensis]